jgi:hypothetical protein
VDCGKPAEGHLTASEVQAVQKAAESNPLAACRLAASRLPPVPDLPIEFEKKPLAHA